MTRLYGVVRKKDFIALNNNEKKEYVLNLIEESLEEECKKLYIKKRDSRLETIELIYKKDKSYVKNMTKDMYKIMSVMQNSVIILDFKNKNKTFTEYDKQNFKHETKYKKILPTPVFTYKIDGSISKISFVSDYKEDVLLYYLIENFDKKFLKEVSFKRTLRMTY